MKSEFSAVFVSSRDNVTPFITKDGSIIREILAPAVAPDIIAKQSLAEATIRPGEATQAHYHPVTEEIYYLLRGVGRMQIGGSVREVYPGDSIAIPPGAVHQIRSIGAEDLVFLCCCAPAYANDDTILTELPEPDPV